MFKLIASPLIWWPVVFPAAAEDGTVKEFKIEMRFSILTEDDFAAFVAASLRVDDLMSDAEELRKAVDADPFIQRFVSRLESVVGSGNAVQARPSMVKAAVLAEIVTDWKLVHAENGDPIPFSFEKFSALLNAPNVYSSALVAYRECRAGRSKARAGN